ncbi:MAG TPA: glycosyltransferase family 4 protein [Sedimentisphaerales bacterium]|nr:glycosyltransferase family 4 protein [Sedimentisphaerales bacterium]
MRIIQIIPGTGGTFYCDNCLRDLALVGALRRQGHDAVVAPMYLPVGMNREASGGQTPIFFGGINVYLQQKSDFFRKTPRWIDRLFDSPRLLRWVGAESDMTSAKDLGEMTVSMLRGEHGRQAKELDRLIEWLGSERHRPDVVCLSNVLLAGLAGSIRGKVRVPVLCLLQDEDGFLDGLGQPYSEQAWAMVRERTDDVDAFIAVSKYYADVMRKRLGLGAGRVHVVHTGISLDGYEARGAEPEVPTVGFLSRMCFNKGLDTLVEAFVRLKKNDRLKNARLRIAGGKNRSDEAFINKIRRRIESCGLVDDVEFVPRFDRDSKLSFFRSLSVLSVPEKQPVAYAEYMLEALAAGVPVVEPASGAFPELAQMTGGAVLFEPNDIGGLVSALERVLLDVDYARQLGRQGREAVLARFNVDQTAEEIVRICEGAVRQFPPGQ